MYQHPFCRNTSNYNEIRNSKRALVFPQIHITLIRKSKIHFIKKINGCSVYSSGKNCSRVRFAVEKKGACRAERENDDRCPRVSAAKGAESETDARYGGRPSWFATDGVRFGRDGGERDNDTSDRGRRAPSAKGSSRGSSHIEEIGEGWRLSRRVTRRRAPLIVDRRQGKHTYSHIQSERESERETDREKERKKERDYAEYLSLTFKGLQK